MGLSWSLMYYEIPADSANHPANFNSTMNRTKFNATVTLVDWCTTYEADMTALFPDDPPIVGQCLSWKLVTAGSCMSLIFTIFSIPPLQRCGKCLCTWALLIWIGSLLCFSGFIIGVNRVPYLTENTLGARKFEYDIWRLGHCDHTGYCWPDNIVMTYKSMLAFACVGTVLLAAQGVAAFNRREEYMDKFDLDKTRDSDKAAVTVEAPDKDYKGHREATQKKTTQKKKSTKKEVV